LDELFVNSHVILGNVATCDAKYAKILSVFPVPAGSPITPSFPFIA